MLRFSISQHTGSKEGDHFDLFLEQDETLKTWRLLNTAFQTAQPARQLKDHRKLYLDFEGEIAGDRGRVRIHDTGTYTVDEWREDRIQVALRGRTVKTRILFNTAARHPEDPGDARWIVCDPTPELRRGAAALLRDPGLSEAPSPELEGLRRSLAQEELRVMAVVDLYTRGGEVDWTHVDLDPEVRRRLESEAVRWKHPWLEAARRYADQLSGLAEQVRKSRPGAPTA
jgi:hypothetical protein